MPREDSIVTSRSLQRRLADHQLDTPADRDQIETAVILTF